MELLPTAFLFRFALAIPYVSGIPSAKSWPLGETLPAIPLFSELDRANGKVALQLVWNEEGIGIGLEVRGKKKPPTARSADLRGDGLTVWIDTRDARGAHRASRYCHEFAIVPHVGNGKTFRPRIMKREIAMARENSASMTETPLIKSEPLDDGYRLQAWLPAGDLHGFDPEQAPRIGFHAIITDGELGERPLTVGTDFATDRDPSLWTSVELSRETPKAPRAGSRARKASRRGARGTK